MKNAVIVDGLRTPFFKAGSIQGLNAVSLGSSVVIDLMQKIQLQSGNFNSFPIDLVVGANIGNQVLPPDGSNVTRLIALEVGIPKTVPAYTVNINCGSGLYAVLDAVKQVELGLANCVLVVAVEVMSDYTAAYSREQRQKFADLLMASKAKNPPWKKIPAIMLALAKTKLMKHDPRWMIEMGLTDPSCDLIMHKISDKIAEKYKISREEMDLFALESHRRAEKAREILNSEIVHADSYDNGVRVGQTLNALAKLRPLNPGGVTTSGNSSQITDGAVALLVANKEWAAAMNLPKLAEMQSHFSALGGCEPSLMGLGPIEAIRNLYKRPGWHPGFKLTSFGVIETNEAFASVVLAQSKLLKEMGLGGFDPAITNPNGGAIAIGHPVSASGARLVLTCAKELKRREQRYGLVTLCVGGGQGVAAVIENPPD